MMGYQHIIWDWNGTLIDDAWLCLEVINRLLREHQLAPVNARQYASIFGFPLEEYCRRLGFDVDRRAYEELSDRFSVLYEERRLECSLRTGALAALERLRAGGVSQSLLSAYQQELLTSMVEHWGLTVYFARVVGADNAYGDGKIGCGQRHLEQLGHEPSRVLLVGDTLHDMAVAAAMGVDCVLVPSGHQGRQRLVAGGVRVVDDLQHLADTIVGS